MQQISGEFIFYTKASPDIHYSNSMIESLYRSLKNNYLYHQGINSIEDLARKADFYFREHNDVIPLAAPQGFLHLLRKDFCMYGVDREYVSFEALLYQNCVCEIVVSDARRNWCLNQNLVRRPIFPFGEL